MPKSNSTKTSIKGRPSSINRKPAGGNNHRAQPGTAASRKSSSPVSSTKGSKSKSKGVPKSRQPSTKTNEMKAATKRTTSGSGRNSKVGTEIKVQKTRHGSSPMSTSTALTKSPGSSISSPNSYASRTSTASRDQKTSKAMKKLTIGSFTISDEDCCPTKGCWLNPHQLLAWILKNDHEAVDDVDEWLEADFKDQVKDAMACFKPKTLLAVYCTMTANLQLIADIDAFDSRTKGENALLSLILDNYEALEEFYAK